MPLTIFLIFLLKTSLSTTSAIEKPVTNINNITEDAFLNTTQLLKKYNYNGEEYIVQTEDGYLLGLHRIVPKSNKCNNSFKPPVLLMHGLLLSSATWIIMGPSHSLGYFLSDLCFDVWMGNSRGSADSRSHMTLDTSSIEYWDFSWHEMALYDIPAFITFILDKTGKEKLFYVGHSLGTTQYFIMNALLPEFSSKVIAMMALAPSAYLGHSLSPIFSLLSKFENIFQAGVQLFGIGEFMPKSEFLSHLAGQACSETYKNLQAICINTVFISTGFDHDQINKTMLPIVLGHMPAGTSTKTILHYAQSMKYNTFREFHYGRDNNLHYYGRVYPPEYPIELADTPIIIWHSDNDYLTQPQDVNILCDRLPNVMHRIKVAWEDFNHIDYVFGKDARALVYEPMAKQMEWFLETHNY